ncbi:MAG: lysophospholipid acyltransferase family protein [bacterium]
MKNPKISHRFEYIGARFFVWLMQVLPHSLSLRVARFIGFLAFDIVGYRRKVATENLRMVFKDAASPRVARPAYACCAMALADFAVLPVLDGSFIANHVKITGLEHLDRALESKKGAVLVTGHFGSWELMGWILVKLGYPLVFAIGKQRNPHTDRLINEIRRRAGIEMIDYSNILKLIQALRSNKFVAMLADQDAGRKGIFVDFFGRPASTTRAPAALSMIAGAPLVCGFIIRSGIGDYHIVIEPPISDGGSPSRKIDVNILKDLTQSYTKMIESYIAKHPDHWLWSHRRWKTQP